MEQRKRQISNNENELQSTNSGKVFAVRASVTAITTTQSYYTLPSWRHGFSPFYLFGRCGCDGRCVGKHFPTILPRHFQIQAISTVSTQRRGICRQCHWCFFFFFLLSFFKCTTFVKMAADEKLWMAKGLRRRKKRRARARANASHYNDSLSTNRIWLRV